ncbi:MAG: hydrogenase maturation nickel metallochaperone HypA [Lachnospiraceae bacterium]|jgi:hydrogenase nickel incorporation protein HypA/HybF|nr:hydrogenase maturation nickel metallochaperone HypA [Lachnospiraceae bacterium]MCH4029996.1 hydrogenase maturation nickel metallochaperone HypA [Lachnospiraceae bacterium]MCH4070344.1 hydrogenase maturation nickel metallochaperone HypA [Lachnospiraceae bacterium]MCI1331570.1 hydrogenase maturation nickel metallochaperone HypA [Lachnospiraceae bacterium]MCI1361051.1 hydrogenase maturation nickel metallochaperone HypA [Lachnospiraceae bacterium]
MHEMGIVLHLAKTLEETAKEQNIIKIAHVTLEVGEVSGILTDYFSDCWDYFKGRSELLKDSVLEVVTTPAVTWCDSCKRTYPTVKYGRTCPYCGSGETWLLYGNQCVIRDITAETADGREGEAEGEAGDLQQG